MNFKEAFLLLHPVITVWLVFPLIGIVLYHATQVRQRRLSLAAQEKSAIAPSVGQEHARMGAYLTSAVVGTTLLAFAHGILDNQFIKSAKWQQNPLLVGIIMALFIATIAALAFLYKARDKTWRGVFATLTGIGLVVLGFQEGIYRKDGEWYISHFYHGLAAALLMVFSLAILPSIYQDRTNRWRNIHVALNVIALLLFIAQGITGMQALREIPKLG